MKQIIIAIDGHSSCGKSTLARQLAQKLNYIYIDTGAMYRAVTLFTIDNKLIISDVVREQELIQRLSEIEISFRAKPNSMQADCFLNGKNVEKEIRGIRVANAVSHVSKIKEVRQYLVHIQQDMGRGGGVVMDGRDIGTVVFPQAELKVFMTASMKVRAERRFLELSQKSEIVSLQEIADNIRKRDFIDQNRKESPLKKAPDAYVLDNSDLSRKEQLEKVLLWVEKVKSSK